jgi:uncharacterized protein
MAHFLYRLLAPRPDFDQTMSEEEMALMGAHATYWTTHLEAGRVVVFGPVADPEGVWGLAVLEVDERAEAEALVAQDPAILSGHFGSLVLDMPLTLVRPPT